MEVVNNLAKSFLLHPEEYAPWLIESCKAYDSSRVLFLLIVLQSTVMQKDSGISFFILFLSTIFPLNFFMYSSAGFTYVCLSSVPVFISSVCIVYDIVTFFYFDFDFFKNVSHL